MDLSTYPPTLQGTQAILRDAALRIKKLWASERNNHKTDDLVVILDTRLNTMRVALRSETVVQLKRHDPKNSLLRKLDKPAPGPNGAVSLWTITGFNEGPVFISSMVVARS